MFGIDVPIFGFTHCRDVAAAVSQAGGMGILGAATFSPEELERELRWLDENCGGRPYGVNVLMAESRTEGAEQDLQRLIPAGHRDFVQQLNERFEVPPLRDGAQDGGHGVARNMGLRSTHGWARPQLEVVFRHKPVVLFSALGPAPADVVERARQKGMKIGGMTGAGRHAEKHIAAGADIITATGYEGGGHNSDVTTMVLVPEVIEAAAGRVPVLAAGGIASGRQIAAALALGAEGAWLGTVWLPSVESDFEAGTIEQMLERGSHDTVRTKAWSGKPTRFLRNPWFDAWEEEGVPKPLGTPLQRILIQPAMTRIAAARMTHIMPVPIGQVVGQLRQRRRVRDIMQDLQKEYLDAIEHLNALQPAQ
ncbi:MAG: nitronate monooxygenase [Burkholderiaceae bacterium]|nr:nitronate monooxygenase [Burkholderiaceae bacterium]